MGIPDGTHSQRPCRRVTATPPQALPPPKVIEQPAAHIHHHWDGVDAEDVAAIICGQQEER